MKNVIFIFLFIIFYRSVFSQAIDKDSIDQISSSSKINYRKYKWDIGTDLVGILDSKNNSQGRNAYSFFIRKNVNHAIRNTFQTRKVGYRLRVGIRTNTDNQNSNYQGNNSTGSNTSKWINSYLYIRPGYEWQKQWERIQFIYGVDLHAGYTLTKYSSDFKQEKNQRFDIGLFGFVGIKYFISPRAAVSTESAWYIYTSSSTNKFEAHTSSQSVIRKASTQIIGSYFIGFYTLNFSFYFN